MTHLRNSILYSGVFALGLTGLAVLITALFRPYLEPSISFPFLVAVWIGAWFYGRAGGFITAVLSAAAIILFFVRVGGSPLQPVNVSARAIFFLVMAGLIAWVTAAWRENRRLFFSTLADIADAVLAADREGRITFLNPVAETLTGWHSVEARGMAATQVLKLLRERTREAIENPLGRALRDRVTVAMDDHTLLVSRSGAEVPIEFSASPVRDDAGDVRGTVLVFRDISKRRQLEEQVSHAQKMDAVGRLAGGVAGDFNNVLTVITGYAELLRTEVLPNEPLSRFVDEIILASERAAALTRHLLAFSRGSTAQPRVMDLNSVITAMEPMLRRLMGQSTELILLTTPGLGRVKADPAQIEQVIVNLATNSRDAMPDGGKLVVETANVDLEEGPGSKNLGLEPGAYVMLAVSDTGTGMDPETRSRLFEPFFTTKGPGKGSGLGLATVYGIIKQSDGQVTVYSQPGCGTIFEIYLPRVKEAITQPVRAGSARGSESILLVDDEEGVRKLVCAILRSNGYDVLEAASGPAALGIYDKNAHKIDLVLTDIVMPQMSGIELGTQLSDRSPGLKILYMSGYRDNPIGAGGDAPHTFLHKPFTPDTLLSKVREVLDAET